MLIRVAADAEVEKNNRYILSNYTAEESKEYVTFHVLVIEQTWNKFMYSETVIIQAAIIGILQFIVVEYSKSCHFLFKQKQFVY